MTSLKTNNIHCKHQYGFHQNHSTVHPLIHLLNHWGEAPSDSPPEYTRAALCDLSKAFDVIDHDILLNKLLRYGKRGIVSHWFRIYLSNRLQFVWIKRKQIMNGSFSLWSPTRIHTGTTAYLIYINDIRNSCQCNILAFAYDTTLYIITFR